MGCFSWKYADTNNKSRLVIGMSAYVPRPDGTVLYENNYDGYGEFCGQDIYELVAEWNKDNIDINNIRKPKREQYVLKPEDKKYFDEAMEQYNIRCRRLSDFKRGRCDKYMSDKYGENWKRSIGIDIACYDEDNARLKYPIKICKKPPSNYAALCPSKSDPKQGL